MVNLTFLSILDFYTVDLFLLELRADSWQTDRETDVLNAIHSVVS